MRRYLDFTGGVFCAIAAAIFATNESPSWFAAVGLMLIALSSIIIAIFYRKVACLERNQIAITFNDLESAMYEWETDSRAGRTRSHEDADSIPIDQRVNESAVHLWFLLGKGF